jgi:hypothetical protein
MEKAAVMEKFIHDENLKLFRKRLTETTDDNERLLISDLIAEYEANYRRWQVKPGPGPIGSA